MVPLPGRARMTRVLIALGCLAATASAASAATTIEVCNKGSATVLVASCKVSSSGSDTVEAWLHIDAGACRDVHRELVLNGAFVLPQGATVNLAFLRVTRSGTLVPYLRSFGYDPDGTRGKPRVLCVPYADGVGDATRSSPVSVRAAQGVSQGSAR